MSETDSIDTATATRALVQAASAAAAAPSIHNTQPWRWRIHDGVADLLADPSRHLAATDPQRRMLVLSCGAALHHACVALEAAGLRPAVRPTPDPADPDHLASVTIEARIPVSPAAMRTLQTTMIRHTDRRPLLDQTVPAADVSALARVAAGFDVDLGVLGWDQVIELAAVTDRSQRNSLDDNGTRAELDAWIGTNHPAGAGIPDEAVPDRAPQTTVPGRDFGHPGLLPISDRHDPSAIFAALSTSTDEPTAWLYAGEALSAIWLAATERDIALLPLSAPVEDPAGRARLRGLLGNSGHPMIVVRLGYADPEETAAVRTPRLDARETVEVQPD